MVEAKQCTPPKMSKQFKNREIAKKVGDSNGSPIETEFLQPRPRKVQRVGTFEDQAPIEQVCVDMTNSLLYNNSGFTNPELALNKQFSFSDRTDKIDAKVIQNKRLSK